MPFFDKKQSRFKMVALTQHHVPNVTWYSPVKQNRWNPQTVMLKMVQRFKTHMWYPQTNTINFYEGGKLVATYKPN